MACQRIRLSRWVVVVILLEVLPSTSSPILSPNLFCLNSSARVLVTKGPRLANNHAACSADSLASLSCDTRLFGKLTTCCEHADVAFVLEHLEHTLQFIYRHMNDRAAFYEKYHGASLGNHPCAEAGQLTVSTRVALLQPCHTLSEDVLTLLSTSVRHMLCTACVGGADGMDAVGGIAEMESNLAAEWRRLSQDVKHLYEELRQHDAAVTQQLRQAGGGACVMEYGEALRRGVLAPASHTITIRPWSSTGKGVRGFQEVWMRWIDELLAISSEFAEGLVAETEGMLLSYFHSQSPDSLPYSLIVQPPTDAGINAGWQRAPYAQHVNSFLLQPQSHIKTYPSPLVTLVVRMPNPGTDLRFDFSSDPLTMNEQTLGEHIRSLQPLVAMGELVRVVLFTSNPDQALFLARAFANSPSVHVVWRRFALFNVDEMASLFAPSVDTSVNSPMSLAVFELQPGGDALRLSKCAQVMIECAVASQSVESSYPMPSTWPSPLRAAMPSSWGSRVAAAVGLGISPASAALRSTENCPEIAVILREYLELHKASVIRLKAGHVERVLIYRCSALGFCGGHGDRLNGILGVLLLAIASRRAFFIDSPRPVPLELLLAPRKRPGACGMDGEFLVDWRMHGAIAAVGRRVNYNDRYNDIVADLPWLLVDETEPVVVLHSNQRITMPVLQSKEARASLGSTITDALISLPYLHANLLELLFEATPLLSARHLRMLDAARAKRQFLIAIHFRAGNRSPEKWNDPPRHQLSDLDHFLNCAASVEHRLGWKDEDVAWHIAADTSDVSKESRFIELHARGKLTFLPAQQSEAAIIHLDRSPQPLAVQGVADTWAQWLTIASADAVVLSTSGFGVTAAETGRLRHAFLGAYSCLPTDITAS